MWQWLAMAAAAPGLAHGAHMPLAMRVQALPAEPSFHAPSLTIPRQLNDDGPAFTSDGMIVRGSVAPNAMLGLGFGSGGGKRKGADVRVGQRAGRSHRPAVTFVLKF